MMTRFAIPKILALALVAGLPFLATPAQAYWGPYGYGWRRPVVVVGPPVIYAPPPRVVYVRPAPVWIGPHWYYGRFIPGHWR